MPGTGDVIYVLGPSLVGLVLGVVVFVTQRALRRGPAVEARSAPDHGLHQSAAGSASDTGTGNPLAGPVRRGAADWGTVSRAADGRYLAVRPSDAVRARAAARRAFVRPG